MAQQAPPEVVAKSDNLRVGLHWQGMAVVVALVVRQMS
jgi:hypothetical protein